jgi:hypothetical protein
LAKGGISGRKKLLGGSRPGASRAIIYFPRFAANPFTYNLSKQASGFKATLVKTQMGSSHRISRKKTLRAYIHFLKKQISGSNEGAN